MRFWFPTKLPASLLKNKKILASLFASAVAGLVFISLQAPAPFRPIEDLVIFGTEGVHIEKETQVSSGDIGSNKQLEIEKDVKIVGNLFAQEIDIDKNSIIDGNVFAKKLKIVKEATILGTSSKDISFPVATIPAIPPFTPGTQDITIATSNQILPPGSYRDVVVKDNASVILAGTYNFRSLEVKQNGVILFDATSTVNIKDTLELAERVIVNPRPATLSVKFITINYAGIKPITIGERAILGFRLIAPNAKVSIGKEGLWRGAVWGREVKISERCLISSENAIVKESDLHKVVEQNHEKFILNEIVVVVKSSTSPPDVAGIAALVNGRITGFVDIPPTYKIEVDVTTPDELDALVSLIQEQRAQLVLFVARNTLSALR